MAELPQRERLHHDVPEWVKPGAVFFVTICTQVRHRETLTRPPVAKTLIESVAHYHQDQIWWVHLFLLMPDHAHALLAVAPDRQLETTVRAWKAFNARHAAIDWQSGFFDHRVRDHRSLDEKAAYIRMNPVRAGLVETPEAWPWVWEPTKATAQPW